MASLAGIAVTALALAGVGVIFGGKQLFEERAKKVMQRRQQARTSIRQFLDDAQFEISKSLRDLSRDLQRRLRDHFSERLEELNVAYRESAESLQRALKDDEQATATHLEALRGSVHEIGLLIEGTREPSSP